MDVYLRKFGTTLISRPAGSEAFKIFEPSLASKADSEKLVIDFDGVITFSPSWGDEFLTPLVLKYKDLVFLKNTQNSSVQASIHTLEETNSITFNFV